MFKGFRDFVLRGNVIDLAVGVIIGAAFKTIVDKFVEGVINPALGAVVGQPNFDDALVAGPIQFGVVLTALVNFVLTAGVIYFVLVLPMNKLMARVKAAPPPADPPAQEKLLAEIRDLLKAQAR
jgi:large conductance mechanosensitive channel